MDDLLEAALAYGRRSWSIFPVHTAGAGRCSCGDSSCKRIAKHPRTTHGLTDASSDEAVIRVWWKRWPGANVAIATGALSGIFVLDIDPQHGGDDSLAKLLAQYGPLPETLTSLTGGGGRHLFFRHPGRGVHVRTFTSLARLPGLDIRGEGGYVVAPPSLHASGKRYRWKLQ